MGTVGTPPAESPLNGFGWLLPPTAMRDLGLDEVTDSDFWKRLTPIDELLSTCDPPLLAVYSHYRCAEYLDANEQPLDPADAALGLTLTFGTLLGDMSEWRPRDDAGTGPWADIAHAMLDRDVLRYHEAISAAFREYTIAGAEIVTRGFGDFLLGWCGWEAPKGVAR